MYEMRLAEALHMTLNQLRRNITADEYPLWRAYELTYGFSGQRITAATAIAGATTARAMGAKVNAEQLIPVFRTQEDSETAREKSALAFLEGLAKRG